ncbi:TPA: hypothetical protein ACFI9U_002301, partial [Neisseria gonorrhoeae]
IYNFDTICFSSKEKIYAGTAADTYSFFGFYFIRLRDTDRYSIAWRRQTLRGRTRTCGRFCQSCR